MQRSKRKREEGEESMSENRGERGWKRRSLKRTECAVWLMAVLTVFLFGGNVVRAEEKTGKICIEYHGRTADTERIPLEGAVFQLYFAGEKQENGWQLSGGFEKAEVSLDDTTASGRREQAETLYEYAREQKITGIEQKTDANGNTTFSGVKEGLYLVAQKEKVTEKTYGSFYAAPFLIGIPGEEGSYEVTVRPKSEWEPPTDTGGGPSEKPEDENKDPAPEASGKPAKPGIQTGDAVRILGIAAAFLLALAVIILSVRRKMQETEEEPDRSEDTKEAEETLEKNEEISQNEAGESKTEIEKDTEQSGEQ